LCESDLTELDMREIHLLIFTISILSSNGIVFSIFVKEQRTTISWASEEFFSEGDHWEIFPTFFQEGAKSGEIWFLPLETKKATFFAENFKI